VPKPRIEGRDPSDGGCFAAGVAVAEDHVVHVAFTEAGAGDQFAQGGSGKLGGGECGQRTPIRPTGVRSGLQITTSVMPRPYDVVSIF
jgi:hypothetical protein